MGLVSVIIPAFNAEDTLAQCLEACLDQTHPDLEVILVDDGSTDDTARIAESFSVHYVRQDNRGPAAARNAGAGAAKGEIIAYTDSDCVPARDWIERLLDGFEEGTAAVGGTYAIANASNGLARMIHEEIAIRHARFGEDVDFLGSFNVAFRKAAFDAAGGFDESFPVASAEDNDLAYRLAGAGHRLRFTAQAKVAHFHPARLGPYLRTQMGHGFWRMKLYAKHPARAQSGDQYAGWSDFAGPPLALVLCAAILAQGAGPIFPGAVPWLAAGLAVPAIIYLALAAPLCVQMVRRSGDARMVAFAGLRLLRDVARAFGMLRGFVTFSILKRGVQ